MPLTSKVVYTGGLRTNATHIASGATILTDAPVDNHGKGEAFSPTDLVAAALAACICTTMGIVADRHSLNIDGVTCEVEKIMASDPRRIAEIKVAVAFPETANFSAKDRALLERTGLTCPVFQSLHPDLKQTISFAWPGANDL